MTLLWRFGGGAPEPPMIMYANKNLKNGWSLVAFAIMALRKYFKKAESVSTTCNSSLSKDQLKEVNREVQQASSCSNKKRGKYNSYTPQQRAQVGKYTAENGPANAAAHFTRTFGFKVNCVLVKCQ